MGGGLVGVSQLSSRHAVSPSMIASPKMTLIMAHVPV
jgi:hypothetical protein